MPSSAPVLFVLAGVNGAGKSSIGGAWLRSLGIEYFNPDEAAARVQKEIDCLIDEANSLAWQEGRRRLEEAIANRSSHAFESTLGGHTIPRLIHEAATAGFDVRIWFVGLATAEQHIARVRARVASGGHAIPEDKIRERWMSSRQNLIALMPDVTELKVFDNSREAEAGVIPEPRLLLDWRKGKIVLPGVARLRSTPEWAKPIVAQALRLQRSAI